MNNHSPYLDMPLRTESQARLESLLKAKLEAKAIYSAAYERCEREKDCGQGGTFSLMRPIQLDLAKRKALDAFVKAEDAYNAALDEYVKAEGQGHEVAGSP